MIAHDYTQAIMKMPSRRRWRVVRKGFKARNVSTGCYPRETRDAFAYLPLRILPRWAQTRKSFRRGFPFSLKGTRDARPSS